MEKEIILDFTKTEFIAGLLVVLGLASIGYWIFMKALYVIVPPVIKFLDFVASIF